MADEEVAPEEFEGVDADGEAAAAEVDEVACSYDRACCHGRVVDAP